eukprot:EG_transcript_59222
MPPTCIFCRHLKEARQKVHWSANTTLGVWETWYIGCWVDNQTADSAFVRRCTASGQPGPFRCVCAGSAASHAEQGVCKEYGEHIGFHCLYCIPNVTVRWSASKFYDL